MFDLLPYESQWDRRLDRFIFQESVNGTFLQSRQFLNYHPSGRFVEASFALEKSGTLAVYFPGNQVTDEQGNRHFISHQGSTFGGPVFSKAFYDGSKVLALLKQADEYLGERYKSVRLKITPQLFCTESPDLIEYVLEHLGYTRHTELSAFTPLTDKADKVVDPLENCEKECRRIFRNSEKFNIVYRDFKDTCELETFYSFLEASKAKHGAHPVHTVAELLDLQKRLNTADGIDSSRRSSIAVDQGTSADTPVSSRKNAASQSLPQERIRFRSIWLEDRYVAGMMMFLFNETRTIHAQYIAPDDSFKEFQPTTCLYINALREAAAQGFKNFSWGISTEDGGNYLNESLFRFKEGFGAKAAVNVTYTKEF